MTNCSLLTIISHIEAHSIESKEGRKEGRKGEQLTYLYLINYALHFITAVR
jgi:hypothetical protein